LKEQDTWTKEDYVYYFPESVLPSAPQERFISLFKARPRWTREEMQPYIQTLAPDKKKQDLLLLKYTRSSSQNGTTTYTSRKEI
jgi:sister chromatid cohesion protein DCC1